MYPILLSLKERAILVIGAGTVATRKVRELITAGGQPVVVAPTASPLIQEWAAAGLIHWQARPFQVKDLRGIQLIFLCTADQEVQEQVLQAKLPEQWLNDTTQQAHSDFFNMGTLREPDFLLAISTLGKDPSKAKALRQALQVWLEENESLF